MRQRGQDEQIGGTLSARASNALLLFRTLLDINGVEIRTHSTVLYNSIYLTEKKLLINQHIYGLPAAKSPMLKVYHSLSPDMVEIYLKVST